MANNMDQELKRLSDGLLAEDEEQSDRLEDFFLEDNDTTPADVQVPYRNYANGYRARTNQPSDVDLEEYSEQVYEGIRPSNKPLILLALVLFICIMLVLCWWVWRLGGTL